MPPLVQYQAPVSQDRVSYIGSGGRSSVSTSADASSSMPGGQPAASPYQYQSTQIAQAVKQALLNSSSLNDVIAEI